MIFWGALAIQDIEGNTIGMLAGKSSAESDACQDEDILSLSYCWSPSA